MALLLPALLAGPLQARAAGKADGKLPVVRAVITEPTGNLTFRSRWEPSKGLHLLVSESNSTRQVVLSLSPAGGNLEFLPAKSFPAAILDAAQYNLPALPPVATNSVEIVLKVRDELWAVYVENRPVAVLPVPFLPPMTVQQTAAEMPAEDEKEARFQKVADVVFHDDFLVPEGDANPLAAWEPQSGKWLLHSIEDELVNPPSNKKGTLQPARSPNFYSLLGTGTNAVIVSGYPFYDMLTVAAAVRVMPGESGLVFMFEEPGRYFSFVVQLDEDARRARLSLQRHRGEKPDEIAVLAAVDTELAQGQWAKLRVRTYLNRVQCFLDNTLVIDLATELPVGGQFGLFVDGSATGARFDDVEARSNHDLDLKDLQALRRHVIAEHGRFFPRRGFLNMLWREETGDTMSPPQSPREQWLAIGSAAHGPHVFSAEFQPQRNAATGGLLAGFTAEDRPCLLFTCSDTNGARRFALRALVNGAPAAVLEETVIAPRGTTPTTPYRLLCDAGSAGELRLYCDDRLVLIHHPSNSVMGASGVYVGPNSALKVARVAHRFERENLYRNKFEKNQVFVTDPFMRHWSSPEGEWITTPAPQSLTWHKSDFFGRFTLRLPFIAGSAVHLGVREGATNGALVVQSTTNSVSLSALDPATGDRTELARAPLLPIATNALARKVAIHYEDFWVWATSDDRLLFKQRLAEPLAGRRIRIAGFTTEQLAQSAVERYNVKDYLFTESLHEWTINGGRWEIVNRFQCDPRWSHMNGESANDLAALWGKYDFSGDFCVEMYAGMRMGWYQRCGDLNMTVMNAKGFAGSGYSVTATGWDIDSSQLYTRLYRNGVVLTESDKYTVPRIREGNVRKGYEPLLRGGRDVHGAWYYIKFRRIGKTLEYWFDNELVFRVEDPDPIPSGSFGLWTFMNSMMIARAKIGAEHITPRAIAFTPASTALASAPARPRPAEKPALLKDGAPLDRAAPALWQADDPVGHGDLTWHTTPDGEPFFVFRNELGGGRMHAHAAQPPRPLAGLAGWSFYVKRTPGAQFNFHYRLGPLAANGRDVTPVRSYLHALSGPTFPRGPITPAGQTAVPPSADAAEGWYTNGLWTRVVAWLPADELAQFRNDRKLLVQVEGFGCLEPSLAIQGLTGNGPGEAYAIRGLSEIRYTAPVLSLATNAPPPWDLAILSAGDGKPLGAFEKMADAQAWIAGVTNCGFLRYKLRASWKEQRVLSDLAWISLPEKMAITAAWEDERHDGIAFLLQADYADPRFVAAVATIGGVAPDLSTRELWRRTLRLPRTPALTLEKTPRVIARLADQAENYAFEFALDEGADKQAPVLLGLNGLTPFLATFESRKPVPPLQFSSTMMKFIPDDPLQGTCLEVCNAGAANRLRTAFDAPFSLAKYPLMLMRYRAQPMAHISLSLGGRYYAALSETGTAAQPVRMGAPLTLDGAWHAWQGYISDAVAEASLQPGLLSAGSAIFGSIHGTDQSGTFTTWSLDDLVFGPAVRQAEQLRFTPAYFDARGVAAVEHTILPGVTNAFDSDAARLSALPWASATNGEAITPAIATLPDGVAHILIRARDAAGNVSPITDVPFLLDRVPLSASHAFIPANKVCTNASLLQFTFNASNGSPLDMDAVSIAWNTNRLTFPAVGAKLAQSLSLGNVSLHWPYILREFVNQAAPDSSNEVVLSGIRDGAGNATPDLRVYVPLRDANDREPPVLLATRYPSNVVWVSAFETPPAAPLPIACSPGLRATRFEDADEGSFMTVTSEGVTNGFVTIDLSKASWNLKRSPYLALRLRRPLMRTNDDTEIRITLYSPAAVTNVITLTSRPVTPPALRLAGADDWQSNRWYEAVVDLPTFIRARQEAQQMTPRLDKAAEDAAEKADAALPAAERKRGRITTLTLSMVSTNALRPLQIQSLLMMGPWKADQPVALDGYDAGGVAAVTWSTGATNAPPVVPSPRPEEGVSSQWWDVRVKDKAGNLSQSVYVPVFGTNTPAIAAQWKGATIEPPPEPAGDDDQTRYDHPDQEP